jgi:DNA polymerase III alpha subunit
MFMKIFKIFPAIQTDIEKVGFDIYDYERIFNDEATKRIIREGQTIGCFYIESPGMRSLLKKMKSDTFEMLTAISSVIRPGVAESGMMAEFVTFHHDPRPVCRIKDLSLLREEFIGFRDLSDKASIPDCSRHLIHFYITFLLVLNILAILKNLK